METIVAVSAMLSAIFVRQVLFFSFFLDCLCDILMLFLIF